jgi:hypothetical protein
MSKLAHHHPVRMSPAMSKAQDLIGKAVIIAAVIGGAIVLFSALTSHGNVTW